MSGRRSFDVTADLISLACEVVQTRPSTVKVAAWPHRETARPTVGEEDLGVAEHVINRVNSEMTQLQIDVAALDAAERRDLANALLRAAWSGILEETRIVLLDLLVDVDDAVLG